MDPDDDAAEPAPFDDRKILRRLQSVLRKLGIEHGTLHEFRHYFITQCADSNVQPLRLMEWVGHKDLKVIMTYYHSDDAASQRAMAAVSFGAAAAPNETGSNQAQNEDTENGQERT